MTYRCCFFVLSLAGISLGTAAATPLTFNKDIRPILSDKCFACHGADPEAREAKLRLDTPEGAFREKKAKAALVAGKPEKSEAWLRMISDDEDEVMPPPESHKSLDAAEKALIKRWIEEGAVYQKHWAFEAPVMPEVPPGEGEEIDRFIGAKLKEADWESSPEADRETLIRRASFALAGLPPSIAEVDQFLGDRVPGAYERMVDRYLASPRFGEEMARYWLDAARYGDTHGMHLDNERQMWAYRDWVINAFNKNLGYDQFTKEQLAGDLMPDARIDQLVATGFNRCNVTTGEGGSIKEEFIFRYAVDRASTTAQVWLGLTAQCAVCHDHKFDPITQKDFYSLYAFFHSNADPAMDGNKLLTAPVIKLTPDDHEAKIAAFEKRSADLLGEMKKLPSWLGYKDLGGEPKVSFEAWKKSKAGQVQAKKSDALSLREFYLARVCESLGKELGVKRGELVKVEGEKAAYLKSIPSTFIFRDLPKPRQSHVMVRGEYDQPGEKVDPMTPAVLPALKKAGARGTRLDLAEWLVSPENPLTSRVAVNRFWQQFFGMGLVKTSHDFGTQGELPSHPELLDFLAVRFQEDGWDVKALVKSFVMSRAFRQTSAAASPAWDRDPENRLLARGPRFRLDAEQLRDQALFVGGLMNLKMGGRGAMPYQPPNIWEPVAFGGSNTRFYKRGNGTDLYRRSIYTFFKRTAPHPMFANFDAPARETFCLKRDRSNTPLQALQLMNDVQHVEAARGLGQRAMKAEGDGDGRMNFIFRAVLSRYPTKQEKVIVGEFFEKELVKYEESLGEAKKVIAFGESKADPELSPIELAAWTLVANLVLNMDEAIVRN